MKMLKEEKIMREWAKEDPSYCQPCESKKDFFGDIKYLIHAVEDRCAETIKECKGIPYDRIDNAGRKWINAPSDVVAAAIQTGRRK
jgi:hypothetical protein